MEINKFYSGKIEQVKKSFSEDFPSVTLFDFFEKKDFIKLQKRIRSLQYKKEKKTLTHSHSKASITLSDKELINFLSKITNKKIKKLSGQVLSFGWKDYTILHDTVKEKQSYDIIIDLTNSWQEDFGGNIIYVDGTGDYVKIPDRRNTLTIVKRKKNIRHFVKYVNNLAGRKKRNILILQV